MAMSKQNYALLAKVLRDQSELDYVLYGYVHTQITDVINAMAEALHAENPRFVRNRFVDACKPRAEITEVADETRAYKARAVTDDDIATDEADKALTQRLNNA